MQKTDIDNKVSKYDILSYCIKNTIPFAIYRLPNTKDSVLIISEKSQQINLNDFPKAFNKNTFIIAPFEIKKDLATIIKADYIIKKDYIRKKTSEKIKSIKQETELKKTKQFFAEFSDYQKQFTQIMNAIDNKTINKAVLSRIIHKKDVPKSLALSTYNSLCSTYPKAYVFMYYTAYTGLWLGASPELLLNINRGKAKTVSLAGTLKQDTNNNWTNKEIEEQAFVSDFIVDTLSNNGITDIITKGPETIEAGNIIHLKTNYSFNINQLNCSLGNFILSLYPTPAVCGMPKEKSFDIICSSEKHNRECYAGFIGFIDKTNINLFVNIRCMKFTDNGINVFVGGGITKDSNVDKEWNETNLKSNTLLDIINLSLI